MPEVLERVELEHHLNDIVQVWLRRKHLAFGDSPIRHTHLRTELDRVIWDALLCLQGDCFVV